MYTPSSETAFLEIIRRHAGGPRTGLEVGIGDDCAVLSTKRGRLLITTDQQLERVHFVSAWTSPFLVGFKALAVNVSDVAAMGGRPLCYVVALGLPAATPVAFVDELYRGLEAAGQRFGGHLAGGDVARSRRGVSLAVTLVGELCGRKPVLRGGAGAGDLICVSGYLGLSALGRVLLRKGHRARKWIERSVGAEKPSNPRSTEQWRRRCLQAHLAPLPEVGFAADLGRSGAVSAMIDLSDGLSTDLQRLCQSSGIGAILHRALLPGCPKQLVSRRVHEKAILHGGEDYGLLFTVPSKKWPTLQAVATRHPTVSLTRIGETTDACGEILLHDGGKETHLAAQGFDHFRPRRSGC